MIRHRFGAAAPPPVRRSPPAAASLVQHEVVDHPISVETAMALAADAEAAGNRRSAERWMRIASAAETEAIASRRAAEDAQRERERAERDREREALLRHARRYGL